ncbi:Hypothetical protein PHPALM_267 [Phytophthora palmivora]|uniref:Uncharacterized protein n=1 Tax=Phytophthora palmivora TaxID=4796 RepID=A0A2P4YVB1_9STRA|nr:Hypothetical protein PHPALM_267 [Phytophthora palmivora]
MLFYFTPTSLEADFGTLSSQRAKADRSTATTEEGGLTGTKVSCTKRNTLASVCDANRITSLSSYVSHQQRHRYERFSR